MSEADRPQIAWMAIGPKSPVYSSDGEVIGKVSKVVGDPDADVFTGLAISPSIIAPERFVDADRVRGIWADRIEVDLTADEAERLPEHKDVPVVRWRPDEGGFFSRLFRR